MSRMPPGESISFTSAADVRQNKAKEIKAGRAVSSADDDDDGDTEQDALIRELGSLSLSKARPSSAKTELHQTDNVKNKMATKKQSTKARLKDDEEEDVAGRLVSLILKAPEKSRSTDDDDVAGQLASLSLSARSREQRKDVAEGTEIETETTTQDQRKRNAVRRAMAKLSEPAKLNDSQHDSKPRSRWSTGKQLRKYQQQLVDEARRKFEANQPSLLIYLPTGGGKTAVAARLVEQLTFDTRTAIFVHRDELAWQMKRSLVEWGCPSDDIGFIKGQAEMNLDRSIQIVSIQTFAKRFIRSDSSRPPKFELIVIDEAHHAMADEYMALTSMYPEAKLLGFTATPYRLSKGEVLHDLFFEMLSGPSIRELTEQGWLVPSTFVRSSSSRGTLTRKGAQLPSVIEAAVLDWKQKWSHRKTLAFCINVAHAQLVCETFERHSIKSAVITGTLGRDDRDRLFRKSMEGDLSVLCTVDVVSEGVDTTWIDCLMMFRPTESRGLFVQQIGRGLRPSEGKRECVVLDEVGNVFRHGFSFKDSCEESEAKPKERIRIFDCLKHRKCKGLAEIKNSYCYFCSHRCLPIERTSLCWSAAHRKN